MASMDDRQELVEHLLMIHGRIPNQTYQVLGLLTHPNVLDEVKLFLSNYQPSGWCTKFEEGWSCIQESAARRETYILSAQKWNVWNSDAEKLQWCMACVRRNDREYDGKAYCD